jgi:hypothetical protein
MPFLKPDHSPIIRHPQGHPISVIAAFNTIGDLRPRYFCIEDDNQEIFKFQISAVHSTKDKPGVKEFYCSYEAYGKLNYINLCFDVYLHKWSVG